MRIFLQKHEKYSPPFFLSDYNTQFYNKKIIVFMPENKGRLVRVIIIDKILAKGNSLTSKEIRATVNSALNGMDFEHVSERTIEKDLDIFKNGSLYGYNFGQVLKHELLEKKPFHFQYSNPGSSIFGLSLTDQEVLDVQALWDILEKLSYADYIGSIKDILEKLLVRNNQARFKDALFIIPDHNPDYKGKENIKILFDAARSRKKVSFHYKSFEKNTSNVRIIFHPYILKEYRSRWFIVGYKEPDKEVEPSNRINQLRTYGLERISDIKPYKKISENGVAKSLHFAEDFTAIAAFDREEFYKYTYGVTTFPGKRPTEIKLWLSPLQMQYAGTMPIHPTQKIIKENSDGSGEITIMIYPGYEFYQDIRGWGKNIKVLSPNEVSDKVFEE